MSKLCTAVCEFMYSLTMEEVFIVTGIQVLVFAFGIILPIAIWQSKKAKN